MPVPFKKITKSIRILNPLKEFALDEIPLEIRFDPLTGQTGRVFDIPYRGPERPDLETVVEHSRKIFCPFCPEALEASTPLFPEEVIPGGRIRSGRATVIPNLVPFDRYAALAIFSGDHYIPMEALTPATMQDAFAAAYAFAERILHVDPLVRFVNINWNYMPPAGSSLVHPHLQVNAGEVPTNEHRLQLEGCRQYTRKTGRSFWQDLMAAEKTAGERYVGEIGNTFWAMSFVPLGFLPDILCVFPECRSLADVAERGFGPFLEGLQRILAYFTSKNIFSFNLSLFAVREEEGFCMNGRICPRFHPRPIGNSDMAYLPILHREPSCFRPPESFCREIREAFEHPPQAAPIPPSA